MMNRIVTTGLSKMYPSGVTAVDSVDLMVRAGEVVGLLGRNGAGKTTLLRMVLDLVRPSAGSVMLIGPSGSRVGVDAVGGLLEQPAFYPFLSGRDNLRVLGRYTDVDDSRVDEMLELVGLAGRGGDRVDSYSQGMRQRLGIAAGLLKDPEVVVLDEPTNGLDPLGVSQIRELVRDLADSRKAVLVSSHLLAEMEQVCDRVVILHEGRSVMEGAPSTMGRTDVVAVRVDDPELAQRAIEPLDDVRVIAVSEDVLEVQVGRERIPMIVERLVAWGVGVFEVAPLTQSLERVFLELTETGGGGS